MESVLPDTKSISKDDARRFSVEIPQQAPPGQIDEEDPGVRHSLSSWSCRVPKQFPCQLKPSRLSTRCQSRSSRLLYVSVITSGSSLHLVSARITDPIPYHVFLTTRHGHVESVLLSESIERAVTLATMLSTRTRTDQSCFTSFLRALPRLDLPDAVLSQHSSRIRHHRHSIQVLQSS
jgi:hypothetical protein